MATVPKTSDQQDESAELRRLRERRDSPAPGSRDAFLALKDALRDEILADCDPTIDLADRTAVRPYVHECVDSLLTQKGIVLNRSEKRQLIEAIVADISG